MLLHFFLFMFIQNQLVNLGFECFCHRWFLACNTNVLKVRPTAIAAMPAFIHSAVRGILPSAKRRMSIFLPILRALKVMPPINRPVASVLFEPIFSCTLYNSVRFCVISAVGSVSNASVLQAAYLVVA